MCFIPHPDCITFVQYKRQTRQIICSHGSKHAIKKRHPRVQGVYHTPELLQLNKKRADFGASFLLSNRLCKALNPRQ